MKRIEGLYYCVAEEEEQGLLDSEEAQLERCEPSPRLWWGLNQRICANTHVHAILRRVPLMTIGKSRAEHPIEWWESAAQTLTANRPPI